MRPSTRCRGSAGRATDSPEGAPLTACTAQVRARSQERVPRVLFPARLTEPRLQSGIRAAHSELATIAGVSR